MNELSRIPVTLSLFEPLQSAPKRMHEFKCERLNETTARERRQIAFSSALIRFILSKFKMLNALYLYCHKKYYEYLSFFSY